MTAFYTADPPDTDDGDGTGAPDADDDYTGDVEGFNATVNTDNTVSLKCSYQGTANFEIEEEDQSVAGTNYYWIATSTNGGRLVRRRL